MKLFAWVLAGTGVLYGLHRLGSWMEDRGWLYYRKKRGSSGTLGSAFLEVQSILEPGKRYVLEEKRKEDVDDEESGDPAAGGGEYQS
jgi:hypothetical protein